MKGLDLCLLSVNVCANLEHKFIHKLSESLVFKTNSALGTFFLCNDSAC